MYNAYVTQIKNLRKHPNADALQLGECFDNTVCVNMDYTDGQVGVYFPTDGQLSKEFAEANNLLRKFDEEGHEIPGGGYMDPTKRNVKAIRLRGEKSDGLFLPLTCLEKFGDIKKLRVGDTITVFNGHEICCKFIPVAEHTAQVQGGGNRTRKRKTPYAPLFVEHADTEQLAYNLNAFRCGDEVEITLKMHGTSQRTGRVPVFTGYKRSWKDKLFRHPGTPEYDWGEVSGTRRVVLEEFGGGFCGSNEFRKQHHEFFLDKLWKGEEVYYEVVGFTHTGQPIMPSCDNKKLQDKEFVKQYGKTTTFSYGCRPGHLGGLIKDKEIIDNESVVYPQSDIYVYRMTMTNEDGNIVEYTPEFMRYRCEQMGVKTVPVMWRGFIDETIDWNDAGMTAGEWAKEIAERYYDGPDPIGKTHVREGVVVRILNRPKFTAYKHKNYSFKVLSGIVAEQVLEGMDADRLAEV